LKAGASGKDASNKRNLQNTENKDGTQERRARGNDRQRRGRGKLGGKTETSRHIGPLSTWDLTTKEGQTALSIGTNWRGRKTGAEQGLRKNQRRRGESGTPLRWTQRKVVQKRASLKEKLYEFRSQCTRHGKGIAVLRAKRIGPRKTMQSFPVGGFGLGKGSKKAAETLRIRKGLELNRKKATFLAVSVRRKEFENIDVKGISIQVIKKGKEKATSKEKTVLRKGLKA